MARAVYIVVLSLGKWWVDFEGKPYGPFSSQEMARLEAISLSRFLTHSGRQSEVWVADAKGNASKVWESSPVRQRVPLRLLRNPVDGQDVEPVAATAGAGAVTQQDVPPVAGEEALLEEPVVAAEDAPLDVAMMEEQAQTQPDEPGPYPEHIDDVEDSRDAA